MILLFVLSGNKKGGIFRENFDWSGCSMGGLGVERLGDIFLFKMCFFCLNLGYI